MNPVQKISAKGPGRVSRDVLRGRALEVARKILNKEGLSALNARRVASGIRAAVGTLYNLFENFDELILRLNLETLEQLEREIAALPALPKDPEEATLVIARAYLEFTARHRNRWASVLEFKTPLPHPLMEEFGGTISRLVAEVERALAPLFPVGAEADRRLAAAVLWTSLEGICSLTAAENLRMVASTNAWDMARSLIVNYLAGLRQTRPPEPPQAPPKAKSR